MGWHEYKQCRVDGCKKLNVEGSGMCQQHTQEYDDLADEQHYGSPKPLSPFYIFMVGVAIGMLGTVIAKWVFT